MIVRLGQVHWWTAKITIPMSTTVRVHGSVKKITGLSFHLEFLRPSQSQRIAAFQLNDFFYCLFQFRAAFSILRLFVQGEWNKKKTKKQKRKQFFSRHFRLLHLSSDHEEEKGLLYSTDLQTHNITYTFIGTLMRNARANRFRIQHFTIK